jgi:hypothetical protein
MTRTTPPPRFSVPAVAPSVVASARETVRLHPRPGAEPPPDASKLGGTFLWPADEPWPRCFLVHPGWDVAATGMSPITKPSGGPYVTVLQLRRADVPELGFPADTDLFQLLWCPNDHEPLFGPVCRVYWRRSDEVEAPFRSASPPAVGDEDYLPAPCVLHPERVTEYLSPYELSEEALATIWAWERTVDAQAVYQYELSVAEGTKVGGHVRWIQDPEIPRCPTGHPMEHLLTVASAEFDGGSWPRWLAVEDDGAWEAPYPHRRSVQSAAGLMLGDMGSLYLFVCRACQDMPTASVAQCS